MSSSELASLPTTPCPSPNLTQLSSSSETVEGTASGSDTYLEKSFDLYTIEDKRGPKRCTWCPLDSEVSYNHVSESLDRGFIDSKIRFESN